MAISGQVKFFRLNRADKSNENCSVAVSSGSLSRNNIRDRKNSTKWISSGSSDIVTETITIDFGATYAIDRLLLVKNNFKNFIVKYDVAGVWTDFSSVVTNEGTQSTIAETTNTKDTNYYEFASVNTDSIQITINTTQTVNDEKEIYQVIASQEIGMFSGFPNIQRTFDRAKTSKKESINGFSRFSILSEQFRAQMSFDNYPTEADHTLIQTLWEGKQSFLIYPCGGDDEQFRYTDLKGNRLEDIYLVWFDSGWSPNYQENVYQLTLSYVLDLTEVG